MRFFTKYFSFRRALPRILYFSVVLAAFSLCGCGRDKESDYYMYYVNTDGDSLVKEPYEVSASGDSEALKTLVKGVDEDPGSVDYRQAKPDNVKITDYTLKEGQLFVYFNEEYSGMSASEEILCRAALVRTFCQVKSVETVSFYVNEVPLQDSGGEPVGAMTADSFVENTGDSINTYKLTVLNLYFADEKGTGLVREAQSVRYGSNVSMEQLVVERLLSGPTSEDAVDTMPEGTKLVSTSTKDGVCYVNFNEAFTEQTENVKSETLIYAVVDSLTELGNVSQVQISINGKSDVSMKDEVSLDAPFERNLDLVVNPDGDETPADTGAEAEMKKEKEESVKLK